MNRIIIAALAATVFASATPAAAQTFKRFDKVEAETDVGGPWRPCFVNAALVGAYDVQCDDYANRIVYDTRIRAPGGQPVAQTAAQAPVEGAWKAGDLVLVSPTYMHNAWQLCAYVRPSAGGHEVTCAGRSPSRVSDDWIRVDPDFPKANANAAGEQMAAAETAAAEPTQAPPAPVAEVYRRYEKVEAETQPGFPWDTCYVDRGYPGAYDLSCANAGKIIVRDLRVRKPGRQPVAVTAAQPVSEGQYRFNDIILASPTYLHNAWQRCVYVRPQAGGHEVMCGGQSGYVVSNDWIRPEPDTQ